MKILIELPSWLGDAVMATPAIENILNYYNQTEITIVGSFISIEALKKLSKNKFEIYIITNQAGIARGMMTIESLNNIHDNLVSELSKYGITIHGIFFCPDKIAPRGINIFLVTAPTKSILNYCLDFGGVGLGFKEVFDYLFRCSPLFQQPAPIPFDFDFDI